MRHVDQANRGMEVQSVQARLCGGTVLNPLPAVKILEARMYDSRGIGLNIWLEGLGYGCTGVKSLGSRVRGTTGMDWVDT